VGAPHSRLVLICWKSGCSNAQTSDRHDHVPVHRCRREYAAVGAASCGDASRIRVTPADETEAEAILRRYADKRFSCTDAASFVVMERIGIDTVFTFDRNFTEHGQIHVLRP
jgi:predicted nucleic acid-binding protein